MLNSGYLDAEKPDAAVLNDFMILFHSGCCRLENSNMF